MVFKNFLRAGALLGAVLAGTPTLAADPIMAYTAVLPPYTLGADPDAPGAAHEMVEEISSRTGIEIQIEYLPWGRAQATVQETPNTILFAATRSEAREPLYSWITLMVEPREVFVTVGEPLNSFTDAADAGLVVVLDNSPRHGRLEREGLANVEPVRETQLAARMLNGGRVVAWYTFDHRAAFVFSSEGLDPSTLTFGEAQSSPQNWMAAHPDFDPAIAAQIDAAMADMRADGTYDEILSRYIN